MENNNNINININNNNNNNNNIDVYDKTFILSKKYCYYCQCCNYCRNITNMNYTFTYNDINNDNLWNRMIELTMSRNNNYKYNEINVGIYIYHNNLENSSLEYNLPIELQKIYLISEFKKKYL